MADDRVLEQARAVWRAAMDRDDAFAAVDRQRRLARGRQPGSDATGGRRVFPAHAVAIAGAIALAGAVVRESAPSAGRAGGTDAPAVAPQAAEAPDGALPNPAKGLRALSSGDALPPLVALAPCFGCGRAGSDAPSVAAGERLVPGERVSVPAGSTLLLCWGIGAGDGTESAISGPAVVVVTASGDVGVQRDGKPEGAPPPAPRWARGEGDHQPERGRSPGAVSRSEPGIEWEGEWRAVQAALRAGDRAGAEHRLRVLLARSSAPPASRERASFALAELELARGATDDDARSRLEGLRASADPALAADAVFLEARATASAKDRAALYARYLAGDPPSPYRELAIVDEASALLEAGDAAGARARAASLRTGGPVPGVAAAALARLERALAAPAR